MAIDYSRVGWEDAPSRQTPLSAANLNHMDNGILALSMAYDEDIPVIQEVNAGLSNFLYNIMGDFGSREDEPVASKNYIVGDYIILGNYLYIVTDAIATGADLVVETNIERTTVGAEFVKFLKPNTIDIVECEIGVGTNETLATITDGRITSKHKVAGYKIVFGNPSAITSDVNVNTSDGEAVITGTCTAQTTATFQLIIPDVTIQATA